MIKKAIIFSFIFALLFAVIAPDFANAMGSSTISDESGLIILGAGIVLVGAWYLIEYSDRDTEESFDQLEPINKTIQKNLTPSGEFIIFRW